MYYSALHFCAGNETLLMSNKTEDGKHCAQNSQGEEKKKKNPRVDTVYTSENI
jgi:hypothetical protein